MLAVRSPRPQPNLRDRFRARRTELMAHALGHRTDFIAALGQSDGLVALFATVLEMR